MWDVTKLCFLSATGIYISTHTSRVGCDQKQLALPDACKHFYSHIPCGMWPQFTESLRGNAGISTHTSRVGCDKINPDLLPDKVNFYSHIPCGMWPPPDSSCNFLSNFYSHIPCGMWRLHTNIFAGINEFLLTHPVWDVTKLCQELVPREGISTHTSRVGCDYSYEDTSEKYEDFYSHIPCGMWHYPRGIKFKWKINFYSHIPCGMWPLYIVYFNHIIPIYYRMDL